MSSYKATIGIECHVQLNTASKLFAGVDNDAREANPNTLISPLCVGLPGALPVVNATAIEKTIQAGLALNAEIANYSKFDRKHYFYPDLPLGYQITQYDQPLILSGVVIAPLPDGNELKVRIHHAHLEADAGKSTHPQGANYSLVDFNRSGTPLIEIVSEPDMHSAQEAKVYAREIYLRMLYAGVSEASLYYGNIRFDVNVSVSKDTSLGVRTETKNLNSFRSVEKAVEFEINRQINELEAGNQIVQETRGWDDDTQSTFSQRSKEDAHDYRYLPEPDLPPIVIENETINRYRLSMPVMPQQIRDFLSSADVDVMSIEALLDYPPLARHLQQLSSMDVPRVTIKRIADWSANEVLSLLSDQDKNGLTDLSKLNGDLKVLNLHQLVRLSKMVEDGLLSSTAAKKLLLDNWDNLTDVEVIANTMDVMQVSNVSELEMIVLQVIDDNQQAANDIRAGELKAIGFLVGQVMKSTGGKANPTVVSDLIKKNLNT